MSVNAPPVYRVRRESISGASLEKDVTDLKANSGSIAVSASEARVSIDQNIYLPWVSETALPDLYEWLLLQKSK